jgi:tagatose 1,6-diphosphate aldolase
MAPETSPGVLHGLAQCATPTGSFAILALDHRQNLRRDLRPDDPGSVPAADLVEFKRQVTRALAATASGILLDPEFGAAQAIADRSLPGSVGLIVALEQTGYAGPPTNRRTLLIEGWAAASVRRLGAAAAKLLVYYHPDAESAADQERLVASAAGACHELDLPLFLEPLTFSPTDAAKLTGEERRRAVIETARRLGRLGVDVLKVEFPYDASVDDQARWREACAELSDAIDVPWILLSGGADPETFKAQVRTACAAGASGVAAGRAVWAEATRLAPSEREAFLRTTAVVRLAELRAIVEAEARPWFAARSIVAPAEPIAEDWFRG